MSSAFRSVALLMFIGITIAQSDDVFSRPTRFGGSGIAAPLPPPPFLPSRPKNSETFFPSKSGEPKYKIVLRETLTPKFEPAHPHPPVLYPSAPAAVAVKSQEPLSFYSGKRRVFAFAKPQSDQTSMDDDDNDDTSSTFSTRHDRQERSVNTNVKLTQNGIHGSNFPEIDSETLRPPSREVILFRVSASGLPNADLFGGEADPFIQMYYSNGSSSDHFENFARTITLKDNHEPSWDDIVKFESYFRGTTQTWRFEVRDHDANDWDDHIGFAFINVDDCVWESRASRIFIEESSCSAQISNGNGVLSVQIL